MKALTLTQPWATLVAIGAKRIETRSWSTSYRGELAIHAAKGYPRKAQMTATSSPFIEQLNRAGYLPDIPLGVIVATCRLADCKRIVTQENLFANAGSSSAYVANGETLPSNGLELSFGDYSHGRFAWILEDVQMLQEPIPAKGALSLWEWETGQQERKKQA